MSSDRAVRDARWLTAIAWWLGALWLGACGHGAPPREGADASVPGASGGASGAPVTTAPDGGESPPTSAPAGACPSGFTVCDGVCLESALVGSDCRPARCPAPPAGTAPPARAAGVTSRGFDWDVATDAAGATTVAFRPGPTTSPLAPTLAVDLSYRVNGAPQLHTVTLAPDGAAPPTSFTWTTQGLAPGDDLSFYFHQTVGVQTLVAAASAPPPAEPLVDSMWFHQIVGQPRDPEPAYPLTMTLAGRFRDRHPNEERYDHYVDTYFDGPVFGLTLVDHGDSVDVKVEPTAKQIAKDALTKIDFKHFECFGAGMAGATPSPTPLCFTPPELAALGVSMLLGDPKYAPGTVQTSVTGLSYGQLLDFEFTFVGTRTYYTEFFEYYVGSGRLQPKVQHPWAHAAGDQSVTDVTVDEFGYAQHVPNISPAELDDFIGGKILFEADFDSHVGYNPPTTFDCPRGVTPGTPVTPIGVPAVTSPLFTAGTSFTNLALATAARPGYTAASCFSCHHLDGKGPPPDASGMGAALLKLFSTAADGASAGPDPMYGAILDPRVTGGGPAEVKASVAWDTVDGQFTDGTLYSLRRPTLSTGSLRDGPLGAATHVSMRIPRPVFGLGLIEAVPDETILAFADPDDANHDGISGRPNLVSDPGTGAQRLGRFGWKAGVASLREQAALAFVNDIGLTSPLYPKHRCGSLQTECLSSVDDAAPELADADLDHIQSYLRGLSVPPRRNFQDPGAIRGKAIFAAIGCSGCHVPNLVTSSTFPVAEMRNIDIQPFTDLLLHDMGPALADDAPLEDGTASGSEWRTCPLWGNGTGPSVMYPAIDAFDPNGDAPQGGVYLHDGRARNITEAILWHGGEAQGPHDLFVGMPAEDRAALVAYVAYPFADPVPLPRCATSSPGGP